MRYDYRFCDIFVIANRLSGTYTKNIARYTIRSYHTERAKVNFSMIGVFLGKFLKFCQVTIVKWQTICQIWSDVLLSVPKLPYLGEFRGEVSC